MSLITKAFYIFIWISVTQEEYFVSKTPSKWLGDKSCTFAKPPLTFSEEKITAQLDGLNTAIDNVWVGFFRKSTELEYIGCVSEIEIKAHTADRPGSSKDPGYCFTICRHRGISGIIGIFNTTCFCLRDDHIRDLNNVLRPYCTLACMSGTDVACGGVQGKENFVSLYRLNNNVTDEISQIVSGSCLLVDKSNQFNWINCSGNGFWYNVLCTDDRNVFEVLKYKSWIDATVLCLQRNSLPANYSASMKAVLNSTSALWTGVIRSNVIYEFDDEVQSHSDIEYGYFTTFDSTYELKFEKYNKNKPNLCVRDANTAKTTSVVSSTVLSRSQTPISSTITSHTDNNITVNYDMEQTQSMKDSSVTVPVVVSVSIVLIIAISISAFVVLRRRGKIPDICGNTNSTKSTSVQTKYESSVKQITEGNQYEHVDDMISNSKIDMNSDVETDNTNYAHTYFVLETIEKQPNIENASGMHAEEMEGSNVYNTLEQELDKKRKQSKTIDNTYDTTKTVAEKLKSKFGKDSDVFGDTDENLYNHTNSVQMKNNNTENVYNVTGDIENAYGDTDTNHDNKAHGDDDTYNHI